MKFSRLAAFLLCLFLVPIGAIVAQPTYDLQPDSLALSFYSDEGEQETLFSLYASVNQTVNISGTPQVIYPRGAAANATVTLNLTAGITADVFIKLNVSALPIGDSSHSLVMSNTTSLLDTSTLDVHVREVRDVTASPLSFNMKIGKGQTGSVAIYFKNNWEEGVTLKQIMAPSWLVFSERTLTPLEGSTLELPINAPSILGIHSGTLRIEANTTYGHTEILQIAATINVTTGAPAQAANLTVHTRCDIVDVPTVYVIVDEGTTKAIDGKTNQTGYVKLVGLRAGPHSITARKSGRINVTTSKTLDPGENWLVVEMEKYVPPSPSPTPTPTPAPEEERPRPSFPFLEKKLSVKPGAKYGVDFVISAEEGKVVNFRIQPVELVPNWIRLFLQNKTVGAPLTFKYQCVACLRVEPPSDAGQKEYTRQFSLMWDGRDSPTTFQVVVNVTTETPPPPPDNKTGDQTDHAPVIFVCVGSYSTYISPGKHQVYEGQSIKVTFKNDASVKLRSDGAVIPAGESIVGGNKTMTYQVNGKGYVLVTYRAYVAGTGKTVDLIGDDVGSEGYGFYNITLKRHRTKLVVIFDEAQYQVGKRIEATAKIHKQTADGWPFWANYNGTLTLLNQDTDKKWTLNFEDGEAGRRVFDCGAFVPLPPATFDDFEADPDLISVNPAILPMETFSQVPEVGELLEVESIYPVTFYTGQVEINPEYYETGSIETSGNIISFIPAKEEVRYQIKAVGELSGLVSGYSEGTDVQVTIRFTELSKSTWKVVWEAIEPFLIVGVAGIVIVFLFISERVRGVVSSVIKRAD